ncbi:hypothetical protein LQ564_18900 [Massilia sp. G4R7]|uniref:Uncharacterized protein n=1 Tax=Massilia phyllostachyos TaxID=2898585 RepID=A0ABS8QA02_9BURK|nr:hypothetical protein [Massilia phyllostachyos]
MVRFFTCLVLVHGVYRSHAASYDRFAHRARCGIAYPFSIHNIKVIIDMGKLDSKVAVVTGGSSGIGFAIAARFI